MQVSEDQIKKNIEALRNKIGDARTGGKGSQRRKVKVVTKAATGGDKAIKTIIKKVGAQQLGVDEVNFFTDDNTVLHFSKPQAYASIQSNTFIVTGEPETKSIKDLLPDILQQLGPKQHKVLKDIVTGGLKDVTEEIPNLVETPADLNKPE